MPDFVGDACKAIASRIRGAVAGVQFDDFHKVKRVIMTVMVLLLLVSAPTTCLGFSQVSCTNPFQ